MTGELSIQPLLRTSAQNLHRYPLEIIILASRDLVLRGKGLSDSRTLVSILHPMHAR